MLRRELLKLLGIGVTGGLAGVRPAPARLFAEDFDAADAKWPDLETGTFHVTLIASDGEESETLEAVGRAHREGDCLTYDFDDLVFKNVPEGAHYTHVGYRHPMLAVTARGGMERPVMSNGGTITVRHGRLNLAG